MNLIEVRNVYKQYKNGVTALSDINVSIPKGSFVFVIGSTASGKSTLIKLLYRQEKPSRGEVYVGGVNVAKLKNRKVYKLRRKLGIVFQDYKLLPNLTVYENVAFALEIYGLPEKEVRKKVMAAIEKVGLKEKYRTYPDNLSGGEQQRVSIARAIVNNPKILICDEPTGNLDPTTSMGIMEIINKINEEGTTVIMATHDRDIVNKYKKRVIKISKGILTDDKEKGAYIE
ncbi:MAG: cell division ATP-binding protein FtsE [Tenericutes bacterium]|nr:cell division ATP-binding protein FtsE [Mycoplasmatota bacterium]